MAEMEPSRKRRRTSSNASLPTPPALETYRQLSACTAVTEDDIVEGDVLDNAVHVLRTEADALANVTDLYTKCSTARTSLSKAVDAILDAQRRRGKLVVCGVGKSAFMAQKFVATCKSLSISTSFLHACEAIHGDLGDVRKDDVVLFVSYSGRTPELLNVLLHLPDEVRIVALTGQTKAEDCRLLDGRDAGSGILLPAPVLETEDSSFGVAAPTTSTTVALAVTDMLALSVAGRLHGKRKKEVFKGNHPGGAIGMVTAKEVKKLKREKEIDMTVLELPSPSISGEDDR